MDFWRPMCYICFQDDETRQLYSSCVYIDQLQSQLQLLGRRQLVFVSFLIPFCVCAKERERERERERETCRCS
jgi:hypothetical protein